VFLLLYIFEGRGRREPVEGEDGVVIIYIFWRKRPAGAGGCENEVSHCVLLNEGKGQRELVGVKTGYETGRVS